MKRTKKILSVLLSLSMLCASGAQSAFAAESRYADTTGHWAETAVERWSEYGVIEGDGTGFNPDGAVTRAQMATVLAKTLGLTDNSENPFADVSADSWYAPYVLRCYAAGIMLGDNGMAYPDSKITRQEAMTMFCRAFGIKADETPNLSAFKDSGEVASWALAYVSALINGGIVSGVSADEIAPLASMSRAALVTILDRAVVQYINVNGEYDLTDSDGIILVTADGATLKGATRANIIVAKSAGSVTFKDASVTGTLTVSADTEIVNDNSTLPAADADTEVKTDADKKTEPTPTPKASAAIGNKHGGSGGGSSGGGSSVPAVSDLTIAEAKTVTGGTYKNVTITDAVANGEVTLSGVTIKGDLTINGGGSNSIKLKGCTVSGNVIMAKKSGEAPRLELTGTPVNNIEVQNPAIIEAADDSSDIANIDTTANVEIKGSSTTIGTLNVSKDSQKPVGITVTGGNVSTINANSETNITGAADSVDTVVASSNVTADSATVQTVEIPGTAEQNVNVTVTGDDPVEVEVNSTNGATVTGNNVTVSTSLETAPDNVTVGGNTVTHVHKWGDPAVTPATCEKDGLKQYECVAEGCTDPVQTKTEVIKMLGHDWDKWTKVDDAEHSRACKNDKTHIEKSKHTWNEGTVTTPATEEKEGVKTFTCTACGATKTEPYSLVSASSQISFSPDDLEDPTVICPTYGRDNLYVQILDSKGVSVWGREYTADTYEFAIGDKMGELAPAEGTAYYSVVINEGTAAKIGEELDRLNNAIQITAAGTAIDYTISYNDPYAGEHQITIPGGDEMLCVGSYLSWYDESGLERSYHSYSHNVNGQSVVGAKKSAEQALKSGYSCDLRAITNVDVSAKCAKITVTPASKKTYLPTSGVKVQWNASGTLLWQKTENAAYYRINIYRGDGLDDVAPVATRDVGSGVDTCYFKSMFDIPQLANYANAIFTVDVQALDADKNVIETVGKLASGIEYTFAGAAPTVVLDVTDLRKYTLTFGEDVPAGRVNYYWSNQDDAHFDGGAFNKDAGAFTGTCWRYMKDLADGDVLSVFIVQEDAATSSVWKYARTSMSSYTYTAPAN